MASYVITILDKLLNKYYFKDENLEFENELDKTTIVKILGIIRFVAKHRTTGGREYLTVIHQYVGTYIGN